MQTKEENLKDYSSHEFHLSYHSGASYIVMEIEGFMEGNVFRKNTGKMLEFLKEKKVNKLLVNACHMRLIRLEDAEWLINSFLPGAIRDGFKVCSFIKPLDYHARLSIENVMYKIPSTFQAAWFEKREEAEQWLEQI
jgi:hypothetical protein